MKRSANVFCLALAMVSALVASARADDGFRCGSGRLVNVGDASYDVRGKCGEPDQISQRTEKRTTKHKLRRWVNGIAEEVIEEQEVEVLIDEWIYDLGPQRFIRTLRFENDHLISVATGKRGNQPR